MFKRVPGVFDRRGHEAGLGAYVQRLRRTADRCRCQVPDPEAEHVPGVGLGRAAAKNAVAVETYAAREPEAIEMQAQVELLLLGSVDERSGLLRKGMDGGQELSSGVGPGVAGRQDLPGQEQLAKIGVRRLQSPVQECLQRAVGLQARRRLEWLFIRKIFLAARRVDAQFSEQLTAWVHEKADQLFDVDLAFRQLGSAGIASGKNVLGRGF